MNWQPIETAKREPGKPVLITDGTLFAAAVPYNYYEPAEIGYNNSPLFGGDTRRPNPDAGLVRKLWHATGCSAFDRDTVTFDGEFNCPLNIEPTHWAPLFERPTLTPPR